MPDQDSRLWSPVRIALLGVAWAAGCAVYEVPTRATAPDGAAGGGNGSSGLYEGRGSAGSPAELDTSGGQPASLTVDAGQAGANDGDGDGDGGGGGGARNGGAGATPGAGSAGSDLGVAGSRPTESQGGNGGTGVSGDGGSTSGSTSCVTGWQNQSACDQCASQVQTDLQACSVILDCYVSNSCGPSSCATTDQKCGPNVLRVGGAAYSIAQDVYTCMCK